eukprot:scaffold72213_cov36-Phaeocystis_antarctica.AAC.1
MSNPNPNPIPGPDLSLTRRSARCSLRVTVVRCSSTRCHGARGSSCASSRSSPPPRSSTTHLASTEIQGSYVGLYFMDEPTEP